MKCPKCEGKGFTELEHGLIRVFCDCEKGKELKAEIIGEIPVKVTTAYAPDKLRQAVEVERYARSRLQDRKEELNEPSNSGVKLVEKREVVLPIKKITRRHNIPNGDVLNDSRSESNSGLGGGKGSPERTKPVNQPARSTNPGKPKQPKKRKTKKRA